MDQDFQRSGLPFMTQTSDGGDTAHALRELIENTTRELVELSDDF
jgi:hypothetical protein